MAEDKIELDLEIDPRSLATLKKQFANVSEAGIDEAFKRLGNKRQQAGVDKVFQSLYAGTAEGQSEAAQASRDKMLGYAKSGVGVATAMASGSVSGVLSSMGPHGAMAAGAVNAVEAMTDTIKKFVQAANPAVVDQLNLAFADISGVIGRTLTPVIERLTPWVRMFGDFLASIMPNAQELDKALRPLDEALQNFKEAINPLIPLIKDDLLVQLRLFAGTLKATVELGKLLSVQSWVAKLGGSKTDNWDSSIGASYQGPANYQGIAEAGKGMHLAGFGYQGTAMDRAADASEDSADTLKQILTILGYIDPTGGVFRTLAAVLPGNN